MSTTRFPRMFGKYALLRPFARGGMGELIIAASGELDGAAKLCILKKVPDDRDSPGLTARLLDEAKVAVRLNHTNLVQVFDAGRVDEELYIAMELIEGRDLRAVWNRTAERRSRIPLDVALFVTREIARGLEYAHGYGGLNLVHRDIAPPNVLLSWHGEVKVTDFGLARSILKNEKTAPGIVYGRIAYLAPEQARGEQADARTDVYATGVILWELLTGRALNEPSEDAVKNLERARHPRIEPPSHITRGLPATIDQVSLKALAANRDERFQSAEQFRKAVADEMGKVAPSTDSSRVASFLKELFGDDIKREQDERERLVSEELPKLRQSRAPKDTPVSPPSLQESRPPPRRPTGAREAALAPTSPPSRRSQLGARPPAARVSDARITAPRAARGAMPAGDVGDEDVTVHRSQPPRENAGHTPSAAAQALEPDENELDLERDREIANLVGEVVDQRYHVERLLGTGGMGAVYEAEHIEIGKKVALKVLHPQYSRQADLVARFRREARAASKVGHPNIVDVTDSGTTGNGDVYFVMERLDGLDLGEVLRHERKVAPDRTVQIGIQICRALAAAHAAGIIHRDLKPENIFLVSRDGNADFVKVLDFGIAKQDMGNQNAPRRLTTPGIAMGTPEYMAPEQAAGKPVDGRVDIYSVGAILYEMLTGEPPHAGANVMEILSKKATEPPTALRELNPDVPEPLEEVVLECLERDPDMRPQTMGALEYELTKSMKGRGSAVAAVLGLRPSDDPGMWADESSKPRPFVASALGQRRSSPSIPPPSGLTGAFPLDASGANVRVANRSGSVPAIQGGAEAPTTPALGEPPPLKKGGSRWAAVLASMVFLGGGGFLAWKYQPWRLQKTPPKSARPTTTDKAPEVLAATERPDPVNDEKMSPAEVERMLEWARRTADGGRIISPPGDNLKELLDRVERADPGNQVAQALRVRATQIVGKRAQLALKKQHFDEAVLDYQGLLALHPDDAPTKQRLARALRLRAARLLERRNPKAALNDANQALELGPEDTAARLVLADSYFALARFDQAASEYERVLEDKPTDKHARRGLTQSQAAKNRPVKKKRGR